jgi:drug/metabolite transporter (DMT)-like permease
VLGYTTPLLVVPGAALFLNEPMTRARLAGTVLGLLGLVAMFNPLAFDWNDHDALLGGALILLAALCWAANILYVRAHKWVSTPFQLTFWQTLLATYVLSTLALLFDGVPQIVWSPSLTGAFLYAGIFGTALAYWATTSLGILATPVIGVVSSTLALGETIDISLLVAMAMILSGIVVGTIPLRRRPAASNKQAVAANVARP